VPHPSRFSGRVGRGDDSDRGPILSPEGEKDGAPDCTWVISVNRKG